MAMSTNKKLQPKLSDSWGRCPTDILLEIFKWLPEESLAVCMFVSKSWKNGANYSLSRQNKWKDLFDLQTNHKNVAQTKWKSLTCDWQEMYEHYMLWHSVAKAHMNEVQVEKIGKIKKINTCLDYLAVVTKNNVQCFDFKTLTKLKTLDIICDDFYETKDMAVAVIDKGDAYELNFYKKLSSNQFDINDIIQKKEALCYKIHENRFYFLDRKNVINSIHSDNGSLLTFEARCYDSTGLKSTMSLHVFNDQIYLVLDNGFIYLVDADRKNISKINEVLQLPAKTTTLIFKHDDLYSYFLTHYLEEVREVDGTNSAKVFWMHHRRLLRGYMLRVKMWPYDNPNKASPFVYIHQLSQVPVTMMVTAECRPTGVCTCVLEHGHILFVGYSDGVVEVMSLRDVFSPEPLRYINLKDLKGNIEDLHVKSIDIRDDEEEKDTHHIYIATSTDLFHICLTHKNSLSYAWSDVVFFYSTMPRKIEYWYSLLPSTDAEK